MARDSQDEINLRNTLVSDWKTRQSLVKQQNFLFVEAAQSAVSAYLKRSNFQSVIMKFFGSRPGKFISTKWGSSVPLDGEDLSQHTPAYFIDQLTANFNGKANVPGFKSQLTGRAGEDTIIVIVSICRDIDLLYHVVHLTVEDGIHHEPTDFYLDSREGIPLDKWLSTVLD